MKSFYIMHRRAECGVLIIIIEWHSENFFYRLRFYILYYHRQKSSENNSADNRTSAVSSNL